MSRRNRLLVIIGLVTGVLVALLAWRAAQKAPSPPRSPLPTPFTEVQPSPMSPSTATLPRSPLSVPPTGTPPVNTATLEAIRMTRPTATLPSSSGIHWPYISPATWRRWALWALAAAGVLGYIGFRLRQDQ